MTTEVIHITTLLAATGSADDGQTSTGQEHPSLDTWIAYHEDRLPEAEVSKLQEHLIVCRECVDLILEIEGFNTPPEEDAEGVSDFEKAAVWRTVQPQVAAAAPRPRFPMALAASLLVGVLGLSAWNAVDSHREITSLQQKVSSLTAPQANAAIHDLLPGATRSLRSAGATFEVPPEANQFTLILNLDRDFDHDAYRVRFVDTEGAGVLEVGDLKPIDHTVTIGLGRQSIEPGEYSVELYPSEGSATERSTTPAETYRLVLVYG